MKIVKAGVEFITLIDGGTILKRLETCGRTCYKSEGRITETSAPAFVGNILKRGHESVLEHCCRASQLEWATISENTKHAWDHGLIQRGG